MQASLPVIEHLTWRKFLLGCFSCSERLSWNQSLCGWRNRNRSCLPWVAPKHLWTKSLWTLGSRSLCLVNQKKTKKFVSTHQAIWSRPGKARASAIFEVACRWFGKTSSCHPPANLSNQIKHQETKELIPSDTYVQKTVDGTLGPVGGCTFLYFQGWGNLEALLKRVEEQGVAGNLRTAMSWYTISAWWLYPRKDLDFKVKLGLDQESSSVIWALISFVNSPS